MDSATTESQTCHEIAFSTPASAWPAGVLFLPRFHPGVLNVRSLLPGGPETTADERVLRGQAVYTPRTLTIYDWLVLGLSNRWIWRCPTKTLRQLYDTNVTGNHLEVGVGTGYFLQHCRFPTEKPRLVLLDLNEHCLHAAACRVAHYQPQCVTANVLEPIAYSGPRFDSIGLNYVLHCLPGDMQAKATAFDHLKELLNPDGVLFGSTLLSGGVPRSLPARRLMAVYNRKGIFSNTGDELDSLRDCLSKRFAQVDVRTHGCAALFVARDS